MEVEVEVEVETHLVGRHGQAAVQVLHQLLEGGSLGGDGVPAVPHHHVPAQVRERKHAHTHIQLSAVT